MQTFKRDLDENVFLNFYLDEKTNILNLIMYSLFKSSNFFKFRFLKSK